MFLKGLLQANGSDYKQLRLYTTGDLNYSPQLLHYLWYFKISYKKIRSRMKILKK